MIFLLISSGLMLLIAGILALRSGDWFSGLTSIGLGIWSEVMLFGTVKNTHPYLWTSAIFWGLMMSANFFMSTNNKKVGVYITAGIVDMIFFIISLCVLFS